MVKICEYYKCLLTDFSKILKKFNFKKALKSSNYNKPYYMQLKK